MTSKTTDTGTASQAPEAPASTDVALIRSRLEHAFEGRQIGVTERSIIEAIASAWMESTDDSN